MAFVTVTGQTKDLKITVRNTGGSNLTGIAASLSGLDAGMFALVCTPPTSLAAGASAAFILRFSPTSSGAKTATLSIVSDDPDEDPFTLALTGIMLSYTVDTDGDGMNVLMSALGFNWQVNQAAMVNTYNTNANGAGYYSAAQIQALNVGARFLQRNPATGQFKLEIGMEKSTNLTNFLPFPFVATQTTVNGQGKIEFLFTVPDNAAFFRLQPQ